MAERTLTPAQQQVVTDLFAQGQDRPQFPADLADRLRADLEAQLRPVKELLANEDPLFISKSTLSRVHQCELHWLSERDLFAWSAKTAVGAVAHRAIELAQGMRTHLAPRDLVDRSIERIIELGQPSTLADFLHEITDVDRADLLSNAADRVTKFQDTFPPLDPAMRPRLESSLRTELCDGAIQLSGKVDLALGRANGTEARVLIVDLKTGRISSSHNDDLRFYALMETLRVGTPPFRLASFYLDSGTWRHEDVDEALLESTLRRVVDAVTTTAQLYVKAREATYSPNIACEYCVLRDNCDGAVVWKETRHPDDEVLTTTP